MRPGARDERGTTLSADADTVPCETPATRATSRIVGFRTLSGDATVVTLPLGIRRTAADARRWWDRSQFDNETASRMFRARKLCGEAVTGHSPQIPETPEDPKQ